MSYNCGLCFIVYTEVMHGDTRQTDSIFTQKDITIASRKKVPNETKKKPGRPSRKEKSAENKKENCKAVHNDGTYQWQLLLL